MEVSIALSVFIAALLAMRVYIQRAMQGNAFNGAMSVGQPFDPNDDFRDTGSYNDSSTAATTDRAEMLPSHAMMEAEHIPAQPWDYGIIMFNSGPPVPPQSWTDQMVDFDLPTGPVPREPANWRWDDGVRLDNTWNNTGSSNTDVKY